MKPKVRGSAHFGNFSGEGGGPTNRALNEKTPTERFGKGNSNSGEGGGPTHKTLKKKTPTGSSVRVMRKVARVGFEPTTKGL
jgi:hypothetical protein